MADSVVDGDVGADGTATSTRQLFSSSMCSVSVFLLSSLYDFVTLHLVLCTSFMQYILQPVGARLLVKTDDIWQQLFG